MDDERAPIFGGLWDGDDPGVDRDPDDEIDEGPRRREALTSKRQWLVLLAGLVIFVLCVVGAVLALQSAFGDDEEPSGTAVMWREPVIEGSTVTVIWDGAPCAREGSSSVTEDAATVEITVRQVIPPALCSSPGDVHTSTFELDAPLGGRDLVDGAQR